MGKKLGHFSFERHKKVLGIIFICLLVVQLFVLKDVTDLGRHIQSTSQQLTTTKIDAQNALINNTVRQEQRTILNGVRESWIQYFQLHPEEPILIKDNDKIIYGNIKGEKLALDPAKMQTVKVANNMYNITDKSGQVLLANCRPLWNEESIKRVLSIIAAPVRAFGPTGDIFVFDSFTGQLIFDASSDFKMAPEILGQDGKPYITLAYKHPNNKNPEATKNVINSELMWRNDSTYDSQIVSFFSEPTNMGDDANNFAKYPLGQYKREFDEKVILPYQSVGVEGQDMQLTVVLGAQEQEIVTSYKSVLGDFDKTDKTINESTMKAVLSPVASVLISLFVIFLALFSLRVSAYACKLQYSKKDEN